MEGGAVIIDAAALGPVRLSCPGLFRLVSTCFLSQNTIKSAEISRLSDQPNTPLVVMVY